MAELLAIPNISEGQDRGRIEAIGNAFDGRLLDVHFDPDHHRCVFTLAGRPGSLAQTVLNGARETVASIDLSAHTGIHPRIGVLDVAPIVYLADEDRGQACAEALVLGDLLAEELAIPVFLYGALAQGRTRAELRRGGPKELGRRMGSGELRPDFGPSKLHPTAGATLVAARPPLVAFNLELAPPATLEDAKQIAAMIREGGSEGLDSVRAIGLWLAGKQIAQVSTNVEDYRRTPLAAVLAAVGRHAQIIRTELVGLAPRAAFEHFPGDVEIQGFATLETALANTAPRPPAD